MYLNTSNSVSGLYILFSEKHVGVNGGSAADEGLFGKEFWTFLSGMCTRIHLEAAASRNGRKLSKSGQVDGNAFWGPFPLR